MCMSAFCCCGDGCSCVCVSVSVCACLLLCALSSQVRGDPEWILAWRGGVDERVSLTPNPNYNPHPR